MADKLFDHETEGPEGKHPGAYQQDMNPHAAAGQNWGRVGPHPEKDDPITAYDVKAVHRHLDGYTDDELRRIPILPAGSRLEQGATYIDLHDAPPREFTARGDMEVGPDRWIVPKSEVDYPLWNKLIGVTDPARLDQGNG